MEFIKTKEDNLAQEYSKELPDNQTVCKDILKLLKNDTTKVIFDKDIDDSYYVFLNNSIYIADNTKNNNLYTRIVLIAHECIHSMQSKILQIFNFLSSNIEVIMFLIILFLKIFLKIVNNVLIYSYVSVCLISLILRLILEVCAVVNSLKLGREYLYKKMSNKDHANLIINTSGKYLKKYSLLFIISLCFGRFVRLFILFPILKM